MKKVIIEVEVRDGQVVALEQNLSNASESFDDLGQSAEKATDRYSGAIKKSNPLVEKLNKLTGGVSNSLLDVADSAKKAGLSMRVAMSATVIGALVVAIGAVVMYWDDISEFVTKTNRSLERQQELMEINNNLLSSDISLLEKQIELGTLNGKNTEVLQKQRLELIKQQQQLNKDQVKGLEAQLVRLEATSTELGLWEQIKLAATFVFLGAEAAASDTADIATERIKQIAELKDAITKAKLEGVALEVVLFNINNPKTAETRGALPQVSAIPSIKAEENIELLDIHQALRDGQTEIDKKYYDDEIARSNAHKELELELKRAQTRLLVEMSADALGNVASILGENSKAGKAIAIAEALINTYLGVSAGVKLGFPLAIPAVASALAVGMKAVQNIKSTKIPTFPGGRGGGGGGGGSVAAISIPQPNFNVVGNTGINQIGDAINGQTKSPSKAYVVYGDMKTAEQLDRESIKSATV